VKLHQIKSTRYWYDLVVRKQEKDFEIRKNDRGYQTGDAVIFWEVTESGEYTGIKSKPFVINFLVTHEEFPQGIANGYCVFGITPHQFFALEHHLQGSGL
jgi:hypothetical protein